MQLRILSSASLGSVLVIGFVLQRLASQGCYDDFVCWSGNHDNSIREGALQFFRIYFPYFMQFPQYFNSVQIHN